jgi:hypothetical protein
MTMLIHRLTSKLSTTNEFNASQTKLPRAQLFAICVCIFLIALSVRLLYWQDNYAGLQAGKPTGLQIMSSFYYDQAQRILHDGGVLFPRNPVDPGDATVLTHPPGYSILMAAISKTFYGQGTGQELSQADSALRIVQIVGDAASAVVLFFIAAELFPAALAIIAAMLCSFSPHFAYYSLLLAPDSLSILPLLLAVYFFIRAIKRPRFVSIITAGALVGLSCWLRSNALLLAPFIAIAIPLLFERGKRLRYSLALVSAAAVIIAPILIRNWIVFHRFIPLSATTGLLLVEGIAEFDKDNRFGMPRSDAEAALKDVEWHGRPEYAERFWRPDGIERDRERLRRGLAVVRSNTGWFLGVMLRRMEFMLKYNDFRQQDSPQLSTAPTLSDGPNFGHKLETAHQMPPRWSSSPPELMTKGTLVSGRAKAVLEDNDLALQITSAGSEYGDFFSSESIGVKPNTDYLLRLSVMLDHGNADVKIGTDDPRIVLALVAASNAVKQRRPKTEDKDAVQPDSTPAPRMKVLLVPFASGENTQIRFSLYKSAAEPAVLNMGTAEVFESGPTPYLWTRYPRAAIRAIQKNFFKTNITRWLIVIGLILLALARRGRALAILLIVPAYFLFVQSPLHTEYRYILAIHYFLFVIVAVTLYYAALVIGRSSRWGYAVAMRQRTATGFRSRT